MGGVIRSEAKRAAAGVGLFLLLLAGAVVWAKTHQTSTLPGQQVQSSDTPNPPLESRFIGEEVLPPRPAVDFTLMDRTGSSFRMRDHKGKIVLLSFAYTSCPSICPLLYKTFSEVEKEWPGKVDRELVLAFVTLDPEADTPARMSDTVRRFGANWHFLTGSVQALQRVWEDYRVYRKKEGMLVDHAGLTYLVDANGLIRIRYGGTPPSRVLVADVEKIMGEKEGPAKGVKRVAFEQGVEEDGGR